MRISNPPTNGASRHRSKREELRDTLKSFLIHYPGANVDDLRHMVGMAAKYILPRSAWDHKGKITHVPRLRLDLHAHPIVVCIFDGFCAIDTSRMRDPGDPTPLLKRMARYDRVLQGKASRKQRKKRLTRYRREMVHVLSTLRVLAGLPADAPAGVRYSMECIGRQFLS